MDAWGAAFAWRACRTGIGPCGATLLASLEGARPTREALLAPALSWYRTLSRSKGTLASAGALLLSREPCLVVFPSTKAAIDQCWRASLVLASPSSCHPAAST